jgi:hypothetical protein
MASYTHPRQWPVNADIVLRGHDQSPHEIAAVIEGTIRYHHQRGGQGQVGKTSVP